MTQKRYSFNNPIIVLANGSFPSHPSAIHYLINSGTIICTDGAADKLIDFGRRPDIIIGDFDSTSINKEDRRGEWIEVLDQNKTDLEKTIEWCIMNGVKKIFLLGSGGEREDHTTGNLFTLAKYHDDIKCDMITNHAKIICLSGENYINTNNNQQVSIIATEPIDSITLEGLQYSMQNEKLLPSARAICNKAISDQFYLKSTGKVLVFLNHID
jgi:thiamine pyrophosphokinase|tara:strand:+ start:71 stop:709 length:639 start_codon:yes stop_codon:yes gene_type:complete